MEEGELDGFVEHAEERFLFLLFAANEFDLMAAKRAKLQGFSSAAAHVVNALIAHHFAAVFALVRDLALGMARAEEGTVFAHDGRRGRGDIKLRNGHGHFGGFYQNLDVADVKGLAGGEGGLRDGFAADAGAVGGVAIVDDELSVGDDHFAVRGGDSRMFDLEVVFRRAPQAVQAQFEFKHLVPAVLSSDH